MLNYIQVVISLKRDEDFIYKIVRSNRKTCAIKIKPDGSVTVCAPYRMPLSIIELFVMQKSDWIEKTLRKISLNNSSTPIKQLNRDEINYLVDDAKRIIPMRVEYYANQMCVTYKRITIRAQRTRWGSCSSKDNLNFNCLLMLAPDDVLDYVVVHELCHLKEMNHSKRFWAEVEKVLPDYRMSYAWLKKHGGELMLQLPEK